MIYKYIVTSEVRSRLEKENLGKDVKDRLENFLSSDNQMSASSLMANLLVSKFNNHSGLRFVWFQEIRKDVCLYILRKIYKHDEYSKKLTEVTKQVWMDRHALSSAEQVEVNEVFAKYFKDAKKDILPDEYRKYEESRAFDKNRDVVFYEMPLWHDGMKKVPKEYWSFIQKAISEDIYKDFVQCDMFFHHTTNNYTITYRFGNPNSMSKSDVYLLQITKGKEPNLEELLDRKYDCDNVVDLQNFSSKCYPDYYTYEYEAWKEIEEDDMANLALSEEEIKVLQDVQFPFFVSGLAGSGKSTILYYLYANIYKYVALQHPNHKLLFLSYNDALVDKARLSVRSILCYHSSNQGFASYFDKEENEQHFRQCFVPFREFLMQAFLDENSIKKFSEDKHITYEKFRELYQKEYMHGGKRLSPSILWSVIRTFIKGRDLEFFTPEKYNSDEIARGDKTVDPKVYNEAYRIWNNWYRHYNEDKGFWDDLDLVRYAFTHGDIQNVFHDYAVIFCDEAQDFTKLEIDLILSLSKHSEYKLSCHPDDRRIPVAFAGDPNQTINPTGFRWAGTKAIFNKSFEESLDTYPELATPELSKNYRSQLGIVKFANTIQSLRYKHFDETSKERKLQSVREDPKGENKDALEYVGFYSYDKYQDVIVENLPNANILTSGDGEEGDLENYPEITNDNVKLNTAIGTKGLEYDAVMLYKFCSDNAYKLFQKIVSGEPFTNDSERFEIAHFFTKLYIAVSRAKSQLFIVDTDESYEMFWKYFTNHELWEKLISQYVYDEEKRKLVGHITLGEIETLPQRLSESYDAEENGRQEFEKAKGNPPSILHMKRARSYFLEAGLTALADECDAYLFLYSNEFEKAGDKFLSLNQEEKKNHASDAYWKGMCWNKLISVLARKCLTSTDSIKLLVAKFMTKEINAVQFVQELVNNRDDFQNAVSTPLKDMEIWTVVFESMKQQLQSLDPINITIALTQNLDFISRYIKWFDKGMSQLRACLYFTHAEFNNDGFSKSDEGFRADGYEKAIKIWEEAGVTQNNQKYFKAKKLTCKSISEEIKWMENLREVNDIVDRFGDESMASSLTEEAAGIVFSCLLSKNFAKAVTYPYPKDKITRWHRLYSQDKGKFLINVLLSDFSKDKFYFLSSKVQNDESSVFDMKLPVSVFEEILSLTGNDANGQPYWSYFFGLKNDKGERVLKNIQNRKAILEALSKKILAAQEYDKSMASCFLEMLFDKEYNFKRAENFNKTIVKIFNRDVFFKEDFRRATERNKYFVAYCDLDIDEHDCIKNNVRKYVENSITTCKKLSGNNIEDFKALFRAYEICGAYQNTYPDYLSICNMYRKFKSEKRLAEMKDWMEQRLLLNQFADENMLQKASYAKLSEEFLEKGLDMHAFADDLSKEDAAMFVAAANTNSEEYSFDCTFITAKLIYKHHLKRDNMKPHCRVNDMMAKLTDAIDIAIDEVLSNKEHVDEYKIKILAYTWDALFEHPFAANHYDKLIEKKRLDRLNILREYLKKRALLHYFYFKEKMFEDKQEEYGMTMSKSYLPVAYPKIEEKHSAKKSDEYKSMKAMQIEEISTTEGKVTKTKTRKRIPKIIVDPAKKAYEEVARNMKSNNMSIELILQCVPQLTIDEIEKL